MKTCKYLYDIIPSAFMYLDYLDALDEKIRCGKRLLSKLVRDDEIADDDRIKAVANAIDFNQRLIDETK